MNDWIESGKRILEMNGIPLVKKKQKKDSGNNWSAVSTPSALLRKSDAVNTEGVSQALERDKKQTSKTKIAPEGIRFNKNKTGFDVEQVKERKKELDNFEDVKIEGVSDEMNRSLINLMQQYNEAKKITSVTERDSAVNKLLQDNKMLLHEYAKSTGYPINTPDINKLNSIERILRQERKDNYISDTYNKRMWRHFDVVHNSDFAHYSGVDEKKAENYLADKVNYTFKNAFDEHGKTKRQGGLPYVPSNGTEIVKDSHGNRVEEGKVIYAINDDDVKWLYMNSDERKIYNYYLNKYGKEQATKFLDDLKLVLDKRYVEAKEAVKTESIAKLKDKNKALGVTVGAADDLVNGLFKLTGEAYGDVISQAIDQYTGTAETIRPYNPYTSATLPTHEARISREAIEDGMSETGKKVTDFALSLGENIERLPAGPVGLWGMAVSVAGDTAVNRGLNGETSAGRAAATGTAYGTAEYLTEKLPLENVLNLMEAPPKTVREWFVQLFKNGLTEFGEEAISNIADNAADEFINGNKSEFAQTVRDYQENGLSIQQATQKAFVDKYIVDTLKSAGSGFLSGVSLAGLGAGVGKLVEGADNRTVNKYKKGAQISIEKANKAVTEAANKAGIENVGLPSAPNWKSASIEEVDNYVNETVKKYNELLNNSKVTDENKETIKQALKDLGVDGEIEVRTKSVSDNDLLNEEVQKRFSDNVDKVFSGKLPRERVIEMGHTPRLLQEYGAGDIPMSITQNTMYKIAYPTGYFGAEDGGHNLGIPALKQLPSQIAQPTAILKSNSQSDSIVLLTEWKDMKGNPVIVPLHLDKNGILGMTNEVASAYGKKDMTPLLTDSDGNSTVMYTKNNEDIHQLLQAGLQLPSVVADDTLVNNSISQNEQNVNNEVNTNGGNTWQVSQLTPSIARYMNGLTGAPSDMSGIETANNTVRSGEYNVFDRDFVNSYADGFVQGMAERNSNAYRTLSSVTDNLARELVNYTLTGQSGLADNQAFRVTAEAFKNVLSDAVNKNAIVHSTSYGSETRLAQQAAAVRNGDFSVMNVGELQSVDAYSDTDPIRGLIPDEFAKVLAESERNAIDSLATAVGRTVKIVPTIGNGKADGCRIGDVLYIAANANDKFTYVFAHELTHSLEGTDGYRNYSSAILDRLAREENISVDELVSRKIAEYAEGGITLDDTGARQELVADFTKNILTDENEAMEFVNSIENAQQRRTVIQWLRDAIRNLINRIRGKFNADVVRLNDLERISNMFEGMLQDAASGNTTQTDSETQFLFAGKNARTANIGTLAQAESLENEGMSVEDIRQQTGWTRGLDGKWRFEIDDSKARFIGNDIIGSHKLSDILEHDALYEAYPELRDMEVFATDNMDIKGKYSPELGNILLNESLSEAEKRKTLLHEVQHAIQTREGFAVGAESSDPNYRNTAGEIEARDVSARADMTAEERQANFPKSMRAREDVVFAENEEYSISFDNSAGNTDELIEVLQNNQQNILQEKAVFYVKQSDIVRAEQPSDTVLNYFNSVGNIAINPTLGEVELVKSGAKATVFHGVGDKKITAVAAIKDVIEKGKIINHEKQWKGRNYDTYVLAGHGLIDDKPAILGVVIKSYPKQNLKNRFYVHEIIKIGADSDGAVNYDAASVNESTPISNDIISENEEIVKQSAKENIGNQTKTDSFKKWFGDWENDPDNASKVVKKDGTPKMVYHGTKADFTVFDKSTFGRNLFNAFGNGFYFTDKKSATKSYGKNVIKAYLSIKNPYYASDSEATRLRTEELIAKGYDGVILSTAPNENIYVAFEPAQIKSATDNIGAFDPNNADIRFAKRNNSDEMNNAHKAASALVKKYNASGRGLYIADVKNALIALAEEIQDDGYSEETYPKIEAHAKEVTKMILDNARVVDESTKEEYDRVSKHVRGTKIKITDELKNSIPDWNNFRKSTMGTLVLSNDGTPVDVVYKDLAAEFPQHFDEHEYIAQSDQLYHIFDTVRGLKPQENTLSETEYDISFEDLTGDIISRAVNIAENYKPRKVKEASQYDDADWNDLAHSDKAWQEWDKQRQEKDRDRQRYNKKLQQIQEKADQRIKRAAEMRKESEDRTKLLNIARRLNNMKLSPENKALVPDIVYELDTVSKGILDKGYTTEDGREVMGRIDLEGLRDRYLHTMETNPDWVPGDYEGEDKEIIRLKNIEKRIDRLNKRQIADMDISDVRELVQTLQQVEHEIRTNNKMLRDAQNREIAQVATSSIGEIHNAKGVKDSTKGSAVDKFWSKQLSPLRFARRLTGWAKNSQFEGLFKAMNDGQLKSTEFKQKASQRFNALVADVENMQKFTGKKAELIDISAYDTEGRKVYITPAMRTALYLHSKNYSNLNHIKYGGITVPNIEMFNKGKITDAYKSNGMIIRLTPSQVRSITNGMTDFEKKFADAAYQFFNDDCKKAVNETSLALNGYEKAVVKDYFPISSNDNFLNKEFDSLKRDGTYEGMGMLKERKYSGNPIVLEDVVKVISRHMNDVADYSGLAVPIRNFNKVYNAMGSKYAYSTKQALNEKWGSNATSYIKNLMTDLQGGRTEKGTALLKKLNSNYAQATLSLNVGVTLQQAGSYPTAAAELGWKPLMQAFSEEVTDADKEIIAKYTPLLWLRSQGYTTSELGDYTSGTSDDWTKRGKMPWLMGWIQKSDMLTTTKLWKASEFYVRDNFSDLEKGSDDYYKKVAEVYNNVIESTQPNYTPMQRADLLRNPNAIVKATSMFRTQPSQNHNLVYDAFGEYKARKADYEANQSAENRAELQAAEKRLRQTLISQVVAAMVVNLFKGVGLYTKGQLFKHYGGKDEDDEGELTPQGVITQFLQDSISTMAGNVWFGSEAVSLLYKTLHDHGIGRGAAVYDITPPTLDMYNDIKNDITKINKMIADGKSNPWYITKTLNKTAVHLGTMFGVPAKNTENLIKGICKDITDATGSGNIFDLLDAWSEGYTKSDKSKYKANMTLEEYMDYQAYYEKTLQDMMSGKIRKKDGSMYSASGAKTQARNEANKKYARLFNKKVE